MAFVSFIDWMQGGVKLDPKFDVHVGAIQEKIALIKQGKTSLDADANQTLLQSLDKQAPATEHSTNKQQTYLLFPGMFSDPKDMIEVAFSLFVQSGGTANILLFQETFEPDKIPEAIDLDEQASRIVRDIRTELDRIAEENKKRIQELQRIAEESKKKTQALSTQPKRTGPNLRRKQQSLVDVHSAPKSQFPILVAYSSGAYATVKAASLLLQLDGQKSKVFILDEPEFEVVKRDAFSQDSENIARTIRDLVEIANIAAERCGVLDLAQIGIKFSAITERLQIPTYEKRVTLFFSKLIQAIQTNTILDHETKSKLIFTLKLAERTINNTVVNYDDLTEPAPLEEIHVLMLEETKKKFRTTNTGGWEKWCKRVIDLDPNNETGLKQQTHLSLPSTSNAERVASLIISHLRNELEPDTEFEANMHRGLTQLDRDIEQAMTDGLSPDTIQRIILEKMQATVLRRMQMSNTALSEPAQVVDLAAKEETTPRAEQEIVVRDERLTLFGRFNPNGATAANRSRNALTQTTPTQPIAIPEPETQRRSSFSLSGSSGK